MPVVFQHIIKRDDLKRNRSVLYVFGDNTKRRGLGGQAYEMRGEPNAVGVATKYFPGSDPEDFFGDEPAQVIAQNRVLDEDMKPLFEHAKLGGVVVWPALDIGTGLSDMPARAPSSWDYLQLKKAALIRAAELFQKGTTDA